MFQGRLIDELTEIVRLAEHRAIQGTEKPKLSLVQGLVIMEPQDSDRDWFVLGAA